MAPLTDTKYLRHDQYAKPDNFEARVRLHREFSINPRSVNAWFFKQAHLPPCTRVLELGCGPGNLWLEGHPEPSREWEVVLSDFSPGMVAQAKHNLAGSGFPFHFLVADAQTIPFGRGHFDAVIANFMLYHVPDREKTLAEVRRVLRMDGRFFAMTFGWDHMLELRRWIRMFHLETILDPPERVNGTFDLVQGRDDLMRAIGPTFMMHYPDELQVTEVQPLLDYVASSLVGEPDPEQWRKFGRFLEGVLARDGVLRIRKQWGLLAAVRT